MQTGDSSSHWPLGGNGRLAGTGQSGNRLQPIWPECTGCSHRPPAQTNAHPASVKKASGGSDPHCAKLAVPGDLETPEGKEAKKQEEV